MPWTVNCESPQDLARHEDNIVLLPVVWGQGIYETMDSLHRPLLKFNLQTKHNPCFEPLADTVLDRSQSSTTFSTYTTSELHVKLIVKTSEGHLVTCSQSVLNPRTPRTKGQISHHGNLASFN